jgi:hypothetical protein
LKTTQWTQVPAGASGSSMISAKLFVPPGAPLHASGGDTSIPSQVNYSGIDPLALKAVEVSVKEESAAKAGTARRKTARERQAFTGRKRINDLPQAIIALDFPPHPP